MNHFFVSIASWNDFNRSERLIYEVPEDCYKQIAEILREDPETKELQSFF